MDTRSQGLLQYHPDLITHQDPMSQVSECFKIARTNIEFSALGDTLKTMVVTSTNQSEGKSLTIANLAIAYAQIGRKVLLIDADLRRPAQHRLFGLSNRRGLTNALLTDGDGLSLVQVTPTENLSVLAAGPIPPNPAELLMSANLEKILIQASADFDLVLLDCTPVGVVTDAAIVATKVDGVIFVVRAGGVNKNQLKRATALLAQVKAHVLGYVMNGINETSDDYYYYYYYYHQGYYQADEPGGAHQRRSRRDKRKSKHQSPESYPDRQQAFLQRQQQEQSTAKARPIPTRPDSPEARVRKLAEPLAVPASRPANPAGGLVSEDD